MPRPRTSNPKPRKDGYRIVTVDTPDGPVRTGEHRAVGMSAWDEPLECFWCGRKGMTWDGEGALKVVVDHIDHDRGNNAEDNLVPSCFPCNARRKRPSPYR